MRLSRVASLTLTVSLWVIATSRARWWGQPDLLRVTVLVSAPMVWGLAMVWFPEFLGRFRGRTGWGVDDSSIDEESPPLLVVVVGWLVLVLPGAAVFCMMRFGG